MLKPILLFVIFLTFITGLLIASKRTNSWNDRLFTIGTFLALLWTFANYLTGIYPMPSFLESTYATGALLLGCGVLWVLYAANRRISRRSTVAVCASAIALACASFVPGFIAARYDAIYFGGVFVGKAGIGLFIYTALFAAAAAIMVSAFYRARKRETDPRRRSQLLFSAIGMISILCISGLTSFVLPSLSIFSFGGLDSVGFLIFLLCIGYSIIRHNLFDIRIVMAELAIFSLWVLTLGALFFSDSQGEFLANVCLLVLSVIVGILLRRSVLREIEQKEQLKELSAQKTEFLSFATHQLRNPLAAIGGYADMLAEEDKDILSPRQKGIVSNMREAAGHLGKITEEFLDSAKIEQGGFVYDMQLFDLAALAREIAQEMEPLARQKKITISFASAKGGLQVIKGDKEKLRHAIQNVVDNAIKYAKEGSVCLEVFKDADNLVLKVSDTGIGVAPEVIGSLFEKFKRGANGERASAGSGLGLYLAREIVLGHGGTIQIESEGLGKGTQVSIILPNGNEK